LNQRRTALRLALLVGFAGLLPVAILGGFALETLRARTEAAATDSLEGIAGQVAARVQSFVDRAHQSLRQLSAGVGTAWPAPEDWPRRFEEASLDAPELASIALVPIDRPGTFGQRIDEGAWRALREGAGARSGLYLGPDQAPRMDECVPVRSRPGLALCAQVDLFELSRFVQRIHVGQSGRALVLDGEGRVVASGSGSYRAAVLTGEDVPHSEAARRMAHGAPAGPHRIAGNDGETFLAGWARVASPPWTVVVQQPEWEALRPARLARYGLAVLSLLALATSLAVGVIASRRMLADLAVEERWRTVGRIASGVSHDLGHRVAVLQHTAALATGGDPSAMPRIAANLETEAATLRRFVSDFADLSRDLALIERRPVDLGALGRSLALSGASRATPAEVRVAVEASPGAWVEGDRYLLERAGMNLIVNAVEATPRGGEVRLTVGREGGECFLRVADDGPGIPPGRLSRLFDAFASTKGAGDHLGMGLPNVKRIAEAHRGRVTAANAPGGGAVFEIRIPAVDPPL
jgi:signal transduction histidine kinase